MKNILGLSNMLVIAFLLFGFYLIIDSSTTNYVEGKSMTQQLHDSGLLK